MRSEYQNRIIIIIPAASQQAANQLAVQMTGWQPDAQTFGISLSADGSEPASHLACSLQAKNQQRKAMLDYAGVIGATWWRMDLSGILQDTNSDLEKVGEQFTFDDALIEMSLQRVQTEEEML